MVNNFFDTISAIATPLQTGAVGIIRISGEKAFDIIKQIFSGKKIEAGKICYGWIENNGQKIDEVIVLPFVKPHSFTGEDVIEIQLLFFLRCFLSIHMGSDPLKHRSNRGRF